MTHADSVTDARGDTLSLDFDLAHPPEKVWRALVDAVDDVRALTPAGVAPVQRVAPVRAAIRLLARGRGEQRERGSSRKVNYRGFARMKRQMIGTAFTSSGAAIRDHPR